MLIALGSNLAAGRSWQETIALALRYGYQGVELFGLAEHPPSQSPEEEVIRCAELVRDAGLVVSCLTMELGLFDDPAAQHAAVVDKVRQACRFADLLGCGLIGQQEGLACAATPSAVQLSRLGERLRAAAEVAAEYEKRLLLEPLPGRGLESPGLMLRLVEMAECDNLGLTFDPANHVAALKKGEVGVLKAYGGRLWNVHIRDVRADGTRCLLGEGEVEFQALWAALAGLRYAGPLAVVGPCPAQPPWPLERVLAHEIAALRASLQGSPLADRVGT
jgi:sugar phosphate isomerase/epimerase